MAGHEVPIEWRGRRVRAWVPDLLEHRDLELSEATARATERAAALVRRGSDELPPAWEALARLLVRAEGMASSAIEGVRAPLAEVAVAEVDPDVGGPASWVADNLAAVEQAISGEPDGALAVTTLHDWHRTLMAGTRHLPEHLIGAPRDAQGWIGGTSPLDAALVTPPPDEVVPLLEDLVSYAARTDLDPVTQAAVAHAQFEVVHPYADGNGRIGRILAGWLLSRRLQLVSSPPLSVRIAVDRAGYLSGLTLYRLGDVDPWVRWFAGVVAGAGEATVNLVRAVEALRERWRARLGDVRADAGAHRALDVLPSRPVLTAATLAHSLEATPRSARSALATLAERGIVAPFRAPRHDVGRPHRWWVAPELVDLVTAWSG